VIFLIYIDDTIWGPWEYKNGLFDEYITEESYLVDFPFGFQTFLIETLLMKKHTGRIFDPQMII